MGAVVRRGVEGDGTGLYAAWESIRQHDASLDRRIVLRPVPEREFVREWRVLMGRQGSAAFVAEDGGRIVGFVSGSIEEPPPGREPARHATIGYIYVDPAHRREGLGRQLFQAMAGWASGQDGVDHFEMTVLAANEEAGAFWRSLGFSPFIQRLWAPLLGPGSGR
jgi:ribosomal protein S18 acetylase RimI-like enzyme